MSRPDPEIELRLAAHPFLKGMSPHHIELLALSAMPTEFNAGQVIFRAGEAANGFYLIETGTVIIEGRSSDEKPAVIDTVLAGEPLGWSWLFSPYLWQFDARANESCTAICISGIMLRQHRDEDLTLSHELFKRMSEVMVRRLQATRSKLISGNGRRLPNVTQIYISKGGQRYGPYSVEELKQQLDSNVFTNGDFASCDDGRSWIRISAVPGIGPKAFTGSGSV